MDNLLIQVTGRKRVVLFSPRDASRLYLIGDKSEVLDIDNPDLQRYPKFRDAAQYVCELQPGDTLFIPALWFHNVTALEFGVAVNVFWKHLDDSFYDVKDTYGNKDLIPAARASQIMDRALKALEEMPEVYRDFYARRIVAKVKRRCYSVDDAGEASGWLRAEFGLTFIIGLTSGRCRIDIELSWYPVDFSWLSASGWISGWLSASGWLRVDVGLTSIWVDIRLTSVDFQRRAEFELT